MWHCALTQVLGQEQFFRDKDDRATCRQSFDMRCLVLIDETICNGCGICADACAFGVPQFGENGIMQKCDLCRDQQLGNAAPPCVDTCPGKALSVIEVSQSEKMVYEEKIMQLLQSG